MKQVILKREKSNKFGTFGTLTITGSTFSCKTVEKPWCDNEKEKSCIPAGTYPLHLEYSNRFKKKLYELKNVPGRSEVKIHNANFSSQLEGCIALGESVAMIGEQMGVTSSVKTLSLFMAALEGDEDATITIHG